MEDDNSSESDELNLALAISASLAEGGLVDNGAGDAAGTTDTHLKQYEDASSDISSDGAPHGAPEATVAPASSHSADATSSSGGDRAVEDADYMLALKLQFEDDSGSDNGGRWGHLWSAAAGDEPIELSSEVSSEATSELPVGLKEKKASRGTRSRGSQRSGSKGLRIRTTVRRSSDAAFSSDDPSGSDSSDGDFVPPERIASEDDVFSSDGGAVSNDEADTSDFAGGLASDGYALGVTGRKRRRCAPVTRGALAAAGSGPAADAAVSSFDRPLAAENEALWRVVFSGVNRLADKFKRQPRGPGAHAERETRFKVASRVQTAALRGARRLLFSILGNRREILPEDPAPESADGFTASRLAYVLQALGLVATAEQVNCMALLWRASCVHRRIGEAPLRLCRACWEEGPGAAAAAARPELRGMKKRRPARQPLAEEELAGLAALPPIGWTQFCFLFDDAELKAEKLGKVW